MKKDRRRILITIDKKYFTFYMPINPENVEDNSYQFMTSIPIVIEMELVKAIVEKQTDALREKLAKGKAKIAPRTKNELLSIN